VSELGLPDAVVPCGHAAPTFGCDSCIATDRTNWAEATYAAWKKAYKLPKCPGCGETMFHYGKNTYPAKLEAVVICPSYDVEGVPTCEDEDIVLVIG
jgi:hypothetical protein